MMGIEDVRWDYLSDLDWIIFAGCAIAVMALTIAGVLLRATVRVIATLNNELDELRGFHSSGGLSDKLKELADTFDDGTNDPITYQQLVDFAKYMDEDK